MKSPTADTHRTEDFGLSEELGVRREEELIGLRTWDLGLSKEGGLELRGLRKSECIESSQLVYIRLQKMILDVD